MVECSLKCLVVLLVLPDQCPGLAEFSLYPRLLDLEGVKGQGISQVRLGELGSAPTLPQGGC
jgi:hypothetical protein